MPAAGALLELCSACSRGITGTARMAAAGALLGLCSACSRGMAQNAQLRTCTGSAVGTGVVRQQVARGNCLVMARRAGFICFWYCGSARCCIIFQEVKTVAKAAKEVQRLDKIVAHLTGMSRQQATRAIKDGDVTVDDEVVTDAAGRISVHAHIVVAGFNDDESGAVAASEAFKKRVFMLNKPFNFVCADRDRNFNTVQSLFKNELHHTQLHCVGRLDVDTTGLIIVTDDGDLNHAVTSPRTQLSKVYLARLDRQVPPSAVKSFAAGIRHPEEKKRYLPCSLHIFEPQEAAPVSAHNGENEGQTEYWAAVQLTEGRYHEVKRLFETVGCEVQELVRVAIGSLTLNEKQQLGEYVSLSEEEIEALLTSYDYQPDQLEMLLERYREALEVSRPMWWPSSCALAQAARAAQAAASTAGAAAAAASASNSDTADIYGNARSSSAATGAATLSDTSDEDWGDEGDFDEVDENGDLRIY